MSRPIARHRSRAPRPWGQALAEFAAVAPFFFLALFAIIEGARFVFIYEMLSNATREGARYAIVHGYNADRNGLCGSGPLPPGQCDPTGQNVRKAVRDAAMGLAGIGDFDVIEPYWCPTDGPKPCPGNELTNERGNPVTVRIVFTYRPIVSLLPPITVTAESTMVINN
ncbi:MAG TPA: TadE family protein [Candidatus Limnocylindrales bacterium]|nr:TadE family protein [Candidatus Limnocylindrales bacterium]